MKKIVILALTVAVAMCLIGECVDGENGERPQICYELFEPVCGYTSNSVPQTYTNACFACANAAVTHYTTGACNST